MLGEELTLTLSDSLGDWALTSMSTGECFRSYKISTEEALEELRLLMPLLRRSEAMVEIREVECVGDLLYLARFTHDGGCAILSADRRIPKRVLAVIDEGLITSADFYLDESPLQYILAYAMEEVKSEPIHEGNPHLRQRIGAWHNLEEVPALLDTKWHQDYPYNDLCPERGKYLHFFGPKAKAPAGCIALSTAQILAYHERPKHFTYKGIEVDLKEMKTFAHRKSNDRLDQMAAALLRGVGAETIIYYGHNGSMGLPCLVRRFLQKYGYRKVETHHRDIEGRTVAMLREGKPLLMAGAGGLRGHAWLVDGFMRHRRDVNTIDPSTDHLISKRVETETLLHCNWGWGGKADGFYALGLFDTRKGPMVYDPKDQIHSMGRYRFDWLFSIITYDL